MASTEVLPSSDPRTPLSSPIMPPEASSEIPISTEPLAEISAQHAGQAPPGTPGRPRTASTPVPSVSNAHATVQPSPPGHPETTGWFKEVLFRLKQQQKQPPVKEPPKARNKETASRPPTANGTTEPLGMSSSAKDLYEGQSKCKCCINWVDCPVGNAKVQEFVVTENLRHAILLRHQRGHDSSQPPYVLHSILVQSPLLRDALSKVFADYPGMAADLGDLVFESPFRCLFYRMKDLRVLLEEMRSAYQQEEAVEEDDGATMPTGASTTNRDKRKTVEHLVLLHGVISDELKSTIRVHKSLVARQLITFDHLWTLYPPGSLVYSSYGPFSEDQIFKVNAEVFVDDKKRLCVPCGYIDCDGQKYGWDTAILKISHFPGVAPIGQLAVIPLDLHADGETLQNTMLERGRKWNSLVERSVHVYQGLARLPDEQRAALGLLPVVEVNGRILLDTEGYRRCIWWEKHALLNDLGKKPGAQGEATLSDMECILSCAAVRGYSLEDKQWCTFTVDSLKPLDWLAGAFDQVFLPDETKVPVLALVESTLKKSPALRTLSALSSGLTLMLSGPPGVGKSLLIESIVDRLKVPMLVLRARELSGEPQHTTRLLKDVISRAESWSAILVLDNFTELPRELLRMTDSYRGVLFLTTTFRPYEVDPEVLSRVDATFEVPDLTTEARRSIWNQFLSECAIPMEVGEEERETLAQMELSGRQIRNACKAAILLATARNETLKADALQRASGLAQVRRELVPSEVESEEEAENIDESTQTDLLEVDAEKAEPEPEGSAEPQADEEVQKQVESQPQEQTVQSEDRAVKPEEQAKKPVEQAVKSEETEKEEEEPARQQAPVETPKPEDPTKKEFQLQDEIHHDQADKDSDGAGSCASTTDLKTAATGKRRQSWRHRWTRMKSGL